MGDGVGPHAPAEGLLLDFGGVVQRSPLELMGRVADGDPALARVLARRGPFGDAPDELWARFEAGEIGEPDYWARRAEEIGAALGQRWEIRDLLTWLFAVPEAVQIRPEAVSLLDDARAAGVPVGILTNDLTAFFGAAWQRDIGFLQRVDVLVDGSVTGVLKPDRAAFEAGAGALGVALSGLVFLDDLRWNVEGARRAGLTAFRVDITDPGAAFAAARAALGLAADSDTAVG